MCKEMEATTTTCAAAAALNPTSVVLDDDSKAFWKVRRLDNSNNNNKTESSSSTHCRYTSYRQLSTRRKRELENRKKKEEDEAILQAQYILVACECYMEYKRTKKCLTLNLSSGGIVESMADQVLFDPQRPLDKDRFNACLARYGLRIASAQKQELILRYAAIGPKSYIRRVDLVRL